MGKSVVIIPETNHSTHLSEKGVPMRIFEFSEDAKVVTNHLVFNMGIKELEKEFNLKSKNGE